MAPTFNKVYEEVGLPYMNGDIQTPEALEQASGEFKNFMIPNTRGKRYINVFRNSGTRRVLYRRRYSL